ncbi:XIAP-associated factor 1 isoform X1 [Canis aureus]
MDDHEPHQQATEYLERPMEHGFHELAGHLSALGLHEPHGASCRELCPDCGQPIGLRVCRREQAWLSTGTRISPPEHDIYCRYCNQAIPGNKDFGRMDKRHLVPELEKCFPVGKPGIPPAPLPSHTAQEQTSKAEKDVRPKIKKRNRCPLPSQNSTKQAARGANRTTTLPLPLRLGHHDPRLTFPAEDEAAYSTLGGCSCCGILLPQPILSQHQERCWWLASSRGTHRTGSG